MISSKQEQKFYCRYKCGTEITFDKRKSKSGRPIPIEVNSGLPHECAKSPYALAHTSSNPVAQVQEQAQAQEQSINDSSRKEVQVEEAQVVIDQLSEIKGLLYEIIHKLDVLKKA